MRHLPFFLIALSILVSADLKAHQILHKGFHQATLEDIQLWKDRYTCELKKIVEIDENGRGVASTLKKEDVLELNINKKELLVEHDDLLMST